MAIPTPKKKGREPEKRRDGEGGAWDARSKKNNDSTRDKVDFLRNCLGSF